MYVIVWSETGYGGWFSLSRASTGQISDKYVHSLELGLYQQSQDHRLQIRDILGYPSLFADILG